MTTRMIAFPLYGGKYSQLGWLLPLLPPCHHYVEPFGGSAAVLLNRVPSPLETYNDLAGDAVTFFRVLRKEPEALVEALTLTPLARQEYRAAVTEDGAGLPDLERARRFFVRARQSYSGLGPAQKPGAWGFAKQTTRRGMSAQTSKWIGSIPGLLDVAARLRMVQLENRAALDILRLYDGPGVLFYVDPPYVAGTREQASRSVYGAEMADQDHAALAQVLMSVRARVALSGYDSPLYAALYAGWHRVDRAVACRHSCRTTARGSTRREVLWTNYEPPGEDR